MITLLERYGDEVKPRAVSSNVVENFFSLARSKKTVGWHVSKYLFGPKSTSDRKASKRIFFASKESRKPHVSKFIIYRNDGHSRNYKYLF